MAISDRFRFSWISISAEACRKNKTNEENHEIIVYTWLARETFMQWLEGKRARSFKPILRTVESMRNERRNWNKITYDKWNLI